MQNVGLWGDVPHLLQKQHETVFLVVKSYKMWVSGGSIYIYTHACSCVYTYIYIYMYTHVYTYV